MPHQVGWYVEGRVIFVRGIGVMTLEDVRQLNADVLTYLNRARTKLHVIVDATTIQEFPLNLIKLRTLATLLDHTLIGWVVVITENKTIEYMARTIPQMLSRAKSHIARSLDEAEEFLMDADHSIDWKKKNDHIVMPIIED